MTRITVWNEFRHEKDNPAVRSVYPDGIHVVLAEALRAAGLDEVRTATLGEPAQGLPRAVLDTTEVLVWWGHRAHAEVSDELVDAVQRRVLAGMGLIVLHSAHFSKIFKRLMGTPCTLKWRDDGEREREEMYGEPFEVPPPEELVFVSWFAGGEVFRSGCCYRRGRGRIFYFRPGHETFPTYHDPIVQRVIANAVRWTAPDAIAPETFVNERVEPIEPLKA